VSWALALWDSDFSKVNELPCWTDKRKKMGLVIAFGAPSPVLLSISMPFSTIFFHYVSPTVFDAIPFSRVGLHL
jgi:hypothetical protein